MNMNTCYIQIGEHTVFVTTADQSIIGWLHQHFKVIKTDEWGDCLPDIYIRIRNGFGQQIDTDIIKPTEAVLRLMDKIFYWAVNPTETVKVLSMCRKLTEQIPSYKLYFQKNNLFWECIS